MIKKVLLLSAFIFSVALSPTTFATDDAAKNNKNAPCKCMAKLFKTLNLTPAQQTKIKAIQTQSNLLRVEKRKEMHAVRSQIRALIREDKLDDAKLDQLLDQKKQISATMIKHRVLVKHQISSVLTPEQKAKYDEMMKNWEEKQLKKDINQDGATS